MRRKDDISELSYALILLGAGQPSDFGKSDIEQVGDTIDSSAKPSWDYPFFPNWGKRAFRGAKALHAGRVVCPRSPAVAGQ